MLKNVVMFFFPLVLVLATAQNVYAKEKASQYTDEDNPYNYKSKQIVGVSEPVILYPGNIKLLARIDTGANTTSLDAENLQIVNEDGEDWAVFSIHKELFKHKIVKFVKIKQHGAESQRRPVIKLKVTLGNVTQVVNVTLTNRSNFKYKMLIGINLLYDNFVVDVSQKNLTKPVKESSL
jgi:hypothetical protein